MSHTIDILKESGVIEITYINEVSLDERLCVVHELSMEPLPLRVLIDVRNAQQAMTELEQEIFGTYLTSLEEFNTARVAILNNRKQSINNIIIKKASENSESSYLTKNFESKQSALYWLKIDTKQTI